MTTLFRRGLRPPRAGASYRAADAGFSLVEGVIAAALLLLIAIGVLPMFAQAIKNNFKGERITEASNFTRSTLESYMRLPFAGTDLTPVGVNTEVITQQWWAATATTAGTAYRWVKTYPTSTPISWTKKVRVTQYTLLKISDYDPFGVLEFPGSQATGAPLQNDPDHVFLKLVEVQMSAGDTAPGAQTDMLIAGAPTLIKLAKVD